MLVGEIMSKDPLYVVEDDFVTKARQLIRDNQLHGLPVLDRDGHVIGIVTIQEMLKITSTRSNVTVAGFVSETPVVCEEDELAEAEFVNGVGQFSPDLREGFRFVPRKPDRPVLKMRPTVFCPQGHEERRLALQ